MLPGFFLTCGRTSVLLATLAIVLTLLLAVYPALPIGGELLDAKLYFTYEEALELMESYGSHGRATYALASLFLDTPLVVAYTCFLAGLLYRLRPAERAWWVAGPPLAAAGVDLCENAQVLLMLASFPDVSVVQAGLAAITTCSKHVILMLCLTGAALLACVAAFSRAAARMRRDQP